MKKERAKVLKIAVFDNPTVVWHPIYGEPREYSHKPYIARNYRVAGYIFAVDSMGLSEIFVFGSENWFWNRVRNGRSRSSKVVDLGTNRKHVYDFLLVINSYRPIYLIGQLVLSCPVSKMLQVICWKERPHPYSIRILGCSSSSRSSMLELRGASEDPKLITYAITFEVTQPIRQRCLNVTDGETERQTDRRADDLL